MRSAKIIDDDNLMLPERFRSGQPHAEWRKLREECPVYWAEPKGFRPYWAITKHADILEVESRPDMFLNEPRFVIMPEAFENYINEKYGSINSLLKILVQMDAPEHTKHRALLQPWFAPKVLQARQQTIEDVCNKFFDKVRENGRDGEIDLAQDVAFWFPLRVACSLLGIPEEEDKHILEISEQVLSFGAPLPGEKSGFEKMLEYCGAVAKDRQKNPKDDLATFLVQAKIDGQPLHPRELLAHFLTVTTAGHDTTASAISGGIKALLEHPDQFRLLREDHAKISAATEEILRWVTPTVQFVRTASEDYVLRGTKIKKGESLCLCFSSANRDEEVFSDPDIFRINRSPNPVMTFGAGPHSCLGSQLARMEIRCFLKVLMNRIDYLEINGPTPHIAANVVTRLERLPVKFRFKN